MLIDVEEITFFEKVINFNYAGCEHIRRRHTDKCDDKLITEYSTKMKNELRRGIREDMTNLAASAFNEPYDLTINSSVRYCLIMNFDDIMNWANSAERKLYDSEAFNYQLDSVIGRKFGYGDMCVKDCVTIRVVLFRTLDDLDILTGYPV